MYCAAKFSKRGPTRSSAARENPVLRDADYAKVFFYNTWLFWLSWLATEQRRKNAAPWKINFSQVSFRSAARRGAAQGGAACSVAPVMINRGTGVQLILFEARRSAARRGIWWGRTSVWWGVILWNVFSSKVYVLMSVLHFINKR